MRKTLITFILSIFFLSANAQIKKVYLIAKMDETHLLDDFTQTNIWAYGIVDPDGTYKATLPGPALEFYLGDTVELHFWNDSPEDHTIHLHGLDVNQQNDGVPATSMAVAQNDSVIYTFVAKNTGVFLYHCHVLTMLHLNMGMYGMITIKNAPNENLLFDGGPSYQTEYQFLASDMDRSVNDNPLSPPLFHLFYQDYFMINGLAGNLLYNDNEHHVWAHQGDSVSIRLANVGYTKTTFIFPEELNAIAYMSDGRVLPQDFECDTLHIYPGERYSILLVPDAYTDNPIQVEYIEMRTGEYLSTNNIQVNGDLSINPNTNELSIYPNPSDGNLIFNTSNPGERMFITDLSGKVLLSKQIVENNTILDLKDFPAGIYLLNYAEQSIKLVRK